MEICARARKFVYACFTSKEFSKIGGVVRINFEISDNLQSFHTTGAPSSTQTIQLFLTARSAKGRAPARSGVARPREGANAQQEKLVVHQV